MINIIDDSKHNDIGTCSKMLFLSQCYSNRAPYSNFTGLSHNITNYTHLLKAFERSLGDFLPLLPSASGIKIGLIDYIIKIVGGALTFALLAIALRRKFERKYTR